MQCDGLGHVHGRYFLQAAIEPCLGFGVAAAEPSTESAQGLQGLHGCLHNSAVLSGESLMWSSVTCLGACNLLLLSVPPCKTQSECNPRMEVLPTISGLET